VEWAALIAPVSGLVDSFTYTAQEQARDAVGAEMARSQSQLAAAQLDANRTGLEVARLNASVELERAATQQRLVLIGGAAVVAAVALVALLK